MAPYAPRATTHSRAAATNVTSTSSADATPPSPIEAPAGGGDPLRVYDDDGAELDATFSVTRTPTGCVLTVESGGPGGSGPNARNREYNAGLRLLIARLGGLDATLEDAHLATRTTRDRSEGQRRLDIDES